MSENFYPPPRVIKPWHFGAVGAVVVAALAGGVAVGYQLAQPPPGALIEATLPQEKGSPTPNEPSSLAALPQAPVKTMFEEGQLLAYRLDAEIEGGGSESGNFSEVYMKFGSDVTLYTKNVASDGSADLKFVFENTGLSGTFMEEPFEWRFDQPADDAQPGSTATQAPASPQTTFLTTPIEMRVGPDGKVLSVSSPSSLKEMLGQIITIPHLEFPDEELAVGKQWETRLKMPIPGIGDAVDTTIVNTLIGRERVGGYDCGIVRQQIGAKQENTQASAPSDSDAKPMLFSVPLFDLQGENLVYFDLKTSQLVHAKLDLDFVLRIKEQLGAAAPILQSLIPKAAGDNGSSEIDKLLHPEGKTDLMDLSLKINGAMSLVNAGPPQPLTPPQSLQ